MVATWPYNAFVPLPTIHTLSIESIGEAQTANPGTVASVVWPAANTAILVPFHLEVPILVTLLLAVNGSAVSGNVDLGIYSAAFKRIVSIGSTVQASTNDVQSFNIADTMIGPGDFYLAAALDNATGTMIRTLLGSALSVRRTGVVRMASAFPLPATITPAAMIANFIPIIGLRHGGTVI